MKKLSFIGSVISLPLLLISINSCKHSKDVETPPKKVQLKTSATFGSYLADKDGRTLYFFALDANGQSGCTSAGCMAVWPSFIVDSITANDIGDGLAITDFSTVTTGGGGKQLTYKGWQLYYYAPAYNGTNTIEIAGQTGGDGVNGTWFISKPDYTIMLARTQLVGHNGKSYKSDYTEGTGATTYFVNDKGLTLYTFKNDRANKNNFTRADFSNNGVWPIYETDKVVVPSILDKSMFSTTDVFGKKQLTYKGWPLYFFGQDAGVRGSNKGVSFPAGPGTWFVAVKDIAMAP
jgi:predicted lipoprotein with Yx(FWY)xxD motif